MKSILKILPITLLYAIYFSNPVLAAEKGEQLELFNPPKGEAPAQVQHAQKPKLTANQLLRIQLKLAAALFFGALTYGSHSIYSEGKEMTLNANNGVSYLMGATQTFAGFCGMTFCGLTSLVALGSAALTPRTERNECNKALAELDPPN